MIVYRVTCDHGPSLIIRDKESAEQEYQDHIENDCTGVTMTEIEMSEEEFNTLPEHPGW